MTKKFIQFLLLLSFWAFLYQAQAQSKLGVKENVEKYFTSGLQSELSSPLSFNKVVKAKGKTVGYSQFFDLSLNQAVMAKIHEQQPQTLYMNFPVSNSKDIKLKLYRAKLFSDNFTLGVNDKNVDYSKLDLGVHYRGVIEGKEGNSLVALSFYKDKIEGFVNNPSIESFELSSIKAPEGVDVMMVRPQDRLSEVPALDCGNTFGDFNYTPDQLKDSELGIRDNLPHCVDLWLEANYNIYQYWGNDLTNTLIFCNALYNGTATIYNNEQITMNLGHLEVWTTTSPYPDPSDPNVDDRSEMLINFQTYRAANFTGDLAELITQNNIGGVAAGFAGLCNNDRTQSMCISGMYQGDVGTYPNYSFNVYISSHELGHLYGSRHTHACVWNGNNTAIDGCAGYTEGGCPVPGYPPNGGTIMSYCWNPYYINFTEGFGPQPGAVIRNSVNNASCLPTCGGCQPPIVTIGANPNPVCSGGTLNLTASGGDTYSWTGPNGFTSSQQNPVITNIQTADAGVYSLTVTAADGCTKDTTVEVFVNIGGSIDPVNDQVYCNETQTNPINFSGNFTSVSWTNDNPNIGLATSGNGNIPSFTATNSGNAPIVGNIQVTSTYSMIDNVVTFDQNGRQVTYSNVQLNSSGNSIAIAPGGAVNLKFDAVSVYSGYCPGCVYQQYIGLGGSGTTLYCYSNAGTSTVNYNADVNFNAPNTPGIYYLTFRSSLQYSCVPQSFSNDAADAIAVLYVGVNPPDCGTNTIDFTITVKPAPVVTATPVTQDICSGQNIQTITLSSNMPNSTFSWSRDNPQVTGIPLSGSGNISGTLTNNSNTAVTVSFFIYAFADGCIGDVDTVQVIVYPYPAATATATPNPACEGELTWFTATGGVGYKWSGPNGFNIEGASFGRHMQLNMAGVYTVTVTSSAGCSSTASVTVAVTSAPNATISITPNPACTGDLIQLSASGGTSYAWSGPAGFTSTQQNPQIPNAKLYHSGQYTVTVTNAAGCSAIASAALKVNETPVGKAWYDEATSCAGSTLQLHASGGGTYQWTGPGGFTSNLQNPTRANVNASHSGIYTVVITGLYGGCKTSYSVNVTIHPLPTINVWTTTPEVCEGDAAYLFASGGTNYDWTGPYGYHSNFQNPIVYNIPAYMEGIYTVTGTNEFGCSASASVYIDVQTVNAIVNATPNPVPYGGTLYLTASGGQFYIWTGPNGFHSYQQNPIIYKFTQVNAGLYACVVSTSAGCQDTEIILVQVKNQNAQDESQLVTRTGKYVQVYPNPTNHYLKIDSEYSGDMNYTILSMDGNISATGTVQNGQEINVQQLISGTYFIQWTYNTAGKTESFISKFVKTN